MLPAGPSQRSRAAHLAQVSASQHAVISRAQAKEAGLSNAAIGRRVATGQWIRVLPGVFRMAVAPETKSQQFAAAALWAGPDGAVSHRTALSVWGCVSDFDLIDVVTAQRRDGRRGIRVHQSRGLPSEHLTTHECVAVTTPERTMLDLCGLFPCRPLRDDEYEFAPDELLSRALEHFLERRLVTLEGLERFLSSPDVRGLSGRRMLARVVRYQRRTQGASFEEEVKAFILREKLPPVQENIRVDGTQGRIALGYPEWKVALVPPGTVLDAPGWKGVTVDLRELPLDPEYVAYRIAYALAIRGAEVGPPLRRWTVRRTWVDSLTRMRVNEAITDWRRGTTGFLPRPWYVTLFEHTYSPRSRREEDFLLEL